MVRVERKPYVPVTQVYYNTPELVLNRRARISGLWCAPYPATVVCVAWCGHADRTGRQDSKCGGQRVELVLQDSVNSGQWQNKRWLWARQRWWVDCPASSPQYRGRLAWRPRVKHLRKYSVNNCWRTTPTAPQNVTVTEVAKVFFESVVSMEYLKLWLRTRVKSLLMRY